MICITQTKKQVFHFICSSLSRKPFIHQVLKTTTTFSAGLGNSCNELLCKILVYHNETKLFLMILALFWMSKVNPYSNLWVVNANFMAIKSQFFCSDEDFDWNISIYQYFSSLSLKIKVNITGSLSTTVFIQAKDLTQCLSARPSWQQSSKFW